MAPAFFKDQLIRVGFTPTEQQLAQFHRYYELLVAANQHVNLTAITDEDEVYEKHFFDSLIPALAVPRLQQAPVSLCDVGAGAGFPSLPLKIMFPQLRITIVDSLNKRIRFLEDLCQELELTDVTLVHARAEEFGGKKSPHRETFDYVTARAVARLSVLSELCLPLVRVGGQLIALKAQKAVAELEAAQRAISLLGGRVAATKRFALPQSGDERNVIVIDKEHATPRQYPRKAGTPAKKPLTNK